MTIAKRPSSASRDARKCGGDLPGEAREESATNCHDGQLVHAGHARIARRADDHAADRHHTRSRQRATPRASRSSLIEQTPDIGHRSKQLHRMVG
jgi:hypothetical protein